MPVNRPIGLRPAAGAKIAGIVGLLVALLVVGVVPSPAAAAAVPPYHPSRLAHVGPAEQIIVVTADSWTSTHAVLRAYEQTADGWRPVISATPARLGWSGLVLAGERRQGTGKTPAGTFAIPAAFGRLPDPGTALPYRQFDRTDAWTYDPRHPSTYNVFQTADRTWRSYGGYVERLWEYGSQYRYVAVLDFNLPDGPVRTGADGVRRVSRPANTRAGGGIFLHVSNGTKTAGCIAIPQERMRAILRWLDPAKHPRIVVGPLSVITRM